jgi:lipopolysaccharide/colanic/teichoic acid biosynthesis glycosyltransferase
MIVCEDHLIRTLDVVVSLLTLVLLAPLFVALMAVLKLTGQGEVFFRQERVGAGGRLFGLYKFATMLRDSPSTGSGLLTLADDPRVLPFGRILQRTKLDELPQLLNILLGDMSIIGPRPQPPAHFEAYPIHVREQLVKVKPGLSGIGSIVFRDEDKLMSQSGVDYETYYRDVIAPYKGELELWFLKNRNVRVYLSLILLTVWVVLKPRSSAHRRRFPDLPPAPAGLPL